MRDLDTRAQLLMKDIDSLANNYLTSQKTLSQDDQKQKLDKIQNFFNKAKVTLIYFNTHQILLMCGLTGIWR